ncbi:MAG: Ig-like domain-containing protein [Methanobacterium sp. ERen5]|nr:MAG: Ig-like domain-containing protein [Methanobacterium sp. ERen5]
MEFLNDVKGLKTYKIVLFALVLLGMVLIFSTGMGDVSAISVNDTYKPTISTVDPVNNAVGVSTSKTVKLTFRELVKKGTMWIEFKNSKGQAVQFTSNLTGKILYIKPKSQLAHQTSYSVILHSGSVKDLAGNGIAMYSTKFTTIKAIKTYSGNGVTFNYPATWYLDSDTDAGDKFVYGTKYFSSISPQFQLQIEANPNGMNDQYAMESIYDAVYPSGFKVISRQIYTLNGNKVYGLIYTINAKYYPVTMETKEINIIKNHKTYTMDFTAPLKTFANEKTDFNIIAQSFKIL